MTSEGILKREACPSEYSICSCECQNIGKGIQWSLEPNFLLKKVSVSDKNAFLFIYQNFRHNACFLEISLPDFVEWKKTYVNNIPFPLRCACSLGCAPTSIDLCPNWTMIDVAYICSRYYRAPGQCFGISNSPFSFGRRVGKFLHITSRKQNNICIFPLRKRHNRTSDDKVYLKVETTGPELIFEASD